MEHVSLCLLAQLVSLADNCYEENTGGHLLKGGNFRRRERVKLRAVDGEASNLWPLLQEPPLSTLSLGDLVTLDVIKSVPTRSKLWMCGSLVLLV